MCASLFPIVTTTVEIAIHADFIGGGAWMAGRYGCVHILQHNSSNNPFSILQYIQILKTCPLRTIGGYRGREVHINWSVMLRRHQLLTLP